MKKLLLLSTALIALTAPAFADPATSAGPAADGENPRFAEFKARHDAMLAKLPPAKAELVRSTMKKLREDGKGDWEKAKALHEELQAIIKAPQFDRAAYIAKASEIRGLRMAQNEKRTQALADLASQLTVEERTTLAGMFGGGNHKDFRMHKSKDKPEKSGQ